MYSRILFLFTVIYVAILGATFAQAQVVGSVFNFDASDDTTATASSWDDNQPAGANASWSLSGPTRVTGINDGKTKITAAYTFDGSDSATMTASWPNTQSDATFEMWIRPTDLTGNEVILDVGGNTDGSSLRLEGGNLIWRSKDNANIAEASADISGLFTPGEFLQAAVEVDLGNEVRLFVDGVEVADGTNGSFGDFAGSDDNALGNNANQIGGNPPGSFSGFDGDIAILRFSDSLLGATAIEENFDALLQPVPEPASIAIWSLIGIGLAGFGYLRSRRRK